ncbi:spore germination protein [Paenibacillus cymbidii]|uniref:spore germination protein n=1 Tax=Paenibacillus cymbidii TaxID=1639034 RepID=UPI001080E837|nr:spore germination protein [Paenibacillus cymbidii]
MKPEAGFTDDSISFLLEDNERRLSDTFRGCGDIVILPWQYGPDFEYAASTVYCESFVKNKKSNFLRDTMQNLTTLEVGDTSAITLERIVRFFEHHGVTNKSAFVTDSVQTAIERVLDGHVVVFFDGWNRAVSYPANDTKTREVGEPVNESVVQGPREGTIENMDVNLAMLRQRVKSPQFKVEFRHAGADLKTRMAFVYLEHAVKPQVLAEFHSRLEGIEQVDVMETSHIEDWIEDVTYSPFPQHRYTERTDTAAAALLDGKILTLVDNTPMILITPATFVEFFGTSEDYYVRTVYATMIRFLRIGAFFIALLLPSIYIALSTFHPELIPTVLLLAILDTREGIPFPALFEALIMEITFELLREAGIRLPKPIGSAVSIVGALVIGQAAIQARIASPIMVIVVALTGIASFAIPHYEMGIALRVLRFPLMLVVGALGFFGLMAGFLVIFLHLCSMYTLGEPYLQSLAPLRVKDLRDVFVRAPIKQMLRKPRNPRLLGNPRRDNR